ncbi:merozoite TRAP-like protein, putative [Plasmodium knowlesi strain H]|uniref:Merozoite TRAP-like protein, putative n=3 Tax=Plasmodium knowlesi TaxID=5850 RepID=A0A5K1V4I4_PLAKH|nr:merozoite TRAP-like protein, putative [Plasmodium knowlesi strain H]OTN68331.1 putative Merozoite TRAP-like protein [Plasmodium knowlesi]CAA9987184.1 merozoite TRAP-like protein, putative [Plasmodium knowlesi strain H]SBO23945.1 merozoite TRAP-like protein, putative [Plasmodium knowlesi strain H]SBO25875.1 merozoite TRAP-like protein, putative [Plasmodium knowlesi strain H]VVS76658.1 merozoite TRAP-like protein, putative [Plasmodium knowlesi strain H]|eukprot:XP_002261805.1 hypothetical protein, conserved in Plasmodium species [Plasmodium knowlesi strain H]
MASFKSLLLNIFFFSLIHISCELIRDKRCEQWDSWSPCKNGISTRICLTDKSVTDKMTCTMCNIWGEWSACQNGKRHRKIVNCPFIREDQDCDPNNSNEENARNNTTIYFNNYDDEQGDNFEETLEEESNLPVTGDNSEPVFLERNSHGERKQQGMRESFAHVDEVDTTAQEHNDMLTDTTPSEASPPADDASENHAKSPNPDELNEPHINSDGAQTDATYDPSSHNPADDQSDTAPFSKPKRAKNFRDHKFDDFSSTPGEGQNKNHAEGDTHRQSFKEQQGNQHEQSKNEWRKKHNAGTGSGGAPKFNQTYIASGMGLLFLVSGSAASYALYNGKYKQLNEEAKNENFEVIFNEDMKARDNSKSMYEDEFWALG